MSYHIVLFVFKQNTAYDLSIRDWSSDVCSSDLPSELGLQRWIEIDGKHLERMRRDTNTVGGRKSAVFLKYLFYGLVSRGDIEPPMLLGPPDRTHRAETLVHGIRIVHLLWGRVIKIAHLLHHFFIFHR